MVRWLRRPELEDAAARSLARAPVTALLGPRQSGKTSLARRLARHAPRGGVHFYDLENPEDLQALENPLRVLGAHRGLIVLDEIQRRPDLFPILRVLADRPRRPARFLVLGSASGALLRQTSESLAGRIESIEVSGFGLAEVGPKRLDRLWMRGGFPRSFLAPTNRDAWAWRKEFLRAFFERDLPQLGVTVPAATLRRFGSMLAHYHGQIVNFSEIGRSLGASDTTIRRYLDLFAGTFLVRVLPPWHENLGKRLVKSPKIYFRDAGLLHSLLGIEGRSELLRHPKVGASWEGFAIEEAIRAHPDAEPYFYRTHAGAEIDLVLVQGGKRWGYEAKFADAPRMTRSLHHATEDLGLGRLEILYPGDRRYPLDRRTEVAPLAGLHRGSLA